MQYKFILYLHLKKGLEGNNNTLAIPISSPPPLPIGQLLHGHPHAAEQ